MTHPSSVRLWPTLSFHDVDLMIAWLTRRPPEARRRSNRWLRSNRARRWNDFGVSPASARTSEPRWRRLKPTSSAACCTVAPRVSRASARPTSARGGGVAVPARAARSACCTRALLGRRPG